MEKNNPSFSIIELPPARWKEFKALRLHALKNDPAAFGSSYREMASEPDAMWVKELNESKIGKKIKYFFAENHKLQVIGMIGVWFQQKEKLRHRAKLNAFFVTKNSRGHGVGEALMKTAIQFLKGKRQYIKKIDSSVNKSQATSLKAHLKQGFRVIGLATKEIKIKSKYYDQFILEKILS